MQDENSLNPQDTSEDPVDQEKGDSNPTKFESNVSDETGRKDERLDDS